MGLADAAIGAIVLLYIPYMRLLLSGVGETLRW
jgi:hypothetical protein